MIKKIIASVIYYGLTAVIFGFLISCIFASIFESYYQGTLLRGLGTLAVTLCAGIIATIIIGWAAENSK